MKGTWKQIGRGQSGAGSQGAPSPTSDTIYARRAATLLGLVLAPVVGASSVITASELVAPTGPDLGRVVRTGLAAMVAGGSVCLPGMFLLAWPWHRCLLAARAPVLPLYMIGFAGVALLCLPLFLFLIGNASPAGWHWELGRDLRLAIGGAIGGAVFWLLRRPDRDLV